MECFLSIVPLLEGINNVSKQTTADTRRRRKSQSGKAHKLHLSNSIKMLLNITLIQRMSCLMVRVLHLTRRGVVLKGHFNKIMAGFS